MRNYHVKKCDTLTSNNESSVIGIDNSVMIEIESTLSRGGVHANKSRAKILTNVVWSS